jgi:phosphatidylserine/phosphatidylglycerophosphate/cardiolipin synthase-like enzyme
MIKSRRSNISRKSSRKSSRKQSLQNIVLKSPSIPSDKSSRKKLKTDPKFSEKNMLLLSDVTSRAPKIGTCSCQILRSASHWSCGLPKNQIENSIQFAYLQLIEMAKHYIYIENQFFISSTAGSPVKNDIAKALVLR